MTGNAGDAVIVSAQIAAGHDGAAELVVRLRYANGAEDAIAIDADAGFELMRNCSASDLSGLVGQPWRRMLKGNAVCTTS
jgi:hypothetical protein